MLLCIGSQKVGKSSQKVDASRRVGRPSVRDLRRQQIVDAFLDLVAANGLSGVSLDDVAAAAGVQRAAIRHFVGNRENLIAAAVEEITTRAVDDDLGTPPSFTVLATSLFSPGRIANLTTAADAWNALISEALRLPGGLPLIKASYDRLIAAISDSLRGEYPEASPARIRDTAYAIACLAEQHFTFQQVGYPRARSGAALDAALALAERLA